MTNLIQFKCPVCDMNNTAHTFCEKEFSEPLDLGYIIIRECRGKKGFPELKRMPLVECLDTEEGKKVFEHLKHITLGLIHSLLKQNLATEKELRQFEEFENLFYENDNLHQKIKNLLQTLKKYEQLVYENDNLHQTIKRLHYQLELFENLTYENENLQLENSELKSALNNSVYAGGY